MSQKTENGKTKNRYTGVLILISTLVVLLGLFIFMNQKSGGEEQELSFFMENDRGSYDLVELSTPAGKGPHPVVLIAHGFAGTLHSGGAVELGKRLAERGMLAVRIHKN